MKSLTSIMLFRIITGIEALRTTLLSGAAPKISCGPCSSSSTTTTQVMACVRRRLHGPPMPMVMRGVQLLILALGSVPSLVNAGFGLGDYRIDVDFFGGEGDLSPAQYVHRDNNVDGCDRWGICVDLLTWMIEKGRQCGMCALSALLLPTIASLLQRQTLLLSSPLSLHSRYKAYLQGKMPATPRGRKYQSPLWYLYSPGLPKIEREAQLAELRYVEQQLGVKFWKVKVDNEKKERFLKSLAEASEAPGDNKIPRRFREEAARSPGTPFFYNLYVQGIFVHVRACACVFL